MILSAILCAGFCRYCSSAIVDKLNMGRAFISGQTVMQIFGEVRLVERRIALDDESLTAWPVRKSGTPITAASSTPGCSMVMSSTSLGNTLKPETLIMSFL